MRQLIKTICWIGCLALGFQSAWAFSLLGPEGTGDAWEVANNGFNPVSGTQAIYPFTDTLPIGPRNLGEGYRRNTPVMYYTFDQSFGNFFGSNGEFAVQQAFDLVNGVFNGQGNTPLFIIAPNLGVLGDSADGPTITLSPTNGIDSYDANLTGFPLNSEGENYLAGNLGLLDLRSYTLTVLMEQLGLADAVRYAWDLHNRYQEPHTTCPVGDVYNVVQRNYDIVPSALNQVQYSQYINGELYNYYVYENCFADAISPPTAAALPVPLDPLVSNPPVASSGRGDVDFLQDGFFFTGLTRDDVGGLRWLYSTNNYDTSSAGYRESPAAGSALFNYSTPQLLYTSNYNALVATSLTNDPATLQTLYPDIQFTYLTNYFSNVVSQTMAYVTNYNVIGGVPGQGYVYLQTTYTTNIVDFYKYSFDNLVLVSNYPSTRYALQTITYGPPVGSTVGTPFVTNISYQPFQSNVVSGDYFVVSNGACAPDLIQTLQTNLILVTNAIAGVTNADGSFIAQNLITYFTNHVFAVLPCTLTSNTPADYQGIGRIQFIRVRDDDYDYLGGQFITPITNQYTMVMMTNGLYVPQSYQRVVTTPDFVFSAQDLSSGPAQPPITPIPVARAVNFNTANVPAGNAGPGTIDPGASNNLVYRKVGTVYLNIFPFLTGPALQTYADSLWGSFDGTTNAPVVYPNGTSLVNLANEQLANLTVNPQFLPDGTNSAPYSVTLSATGHVPPYTWSLSPVSAGGLPPGLTLSASGVISGEPASGAPYAVAYPFTIQVRDSSTPPYTMDVNYSITIYPNQ